MNHYSFALYIFIFVNMVCSVNAQSTSNPQISVKEIVSARDPFPYKSLENSFIRLQKRYDNTKQCFASAVRYYDMDKNPSTIERVMIDQTIDDEAYLAEGRVYFELPVLKINDYKIYIAGHDGKIGKAIGTTHIIAGTENCNRKNNRYIGREDMVNDLLKFAKSSQNKAFPVKEVEMIIYPMYKTDGFTMTNVDTSWVQKSGMLSRNYGTQVFGTPEVNTKLGNYKVSFYSNDDNLGDYETVVINRDDGLRCKVERLKVNRIIFLTDDGYYDYIDVKLIDLYDPILGNYTIIDNLLFDSLLTLKEDTVNNKAISFNLERPVLFNTDDICTIDEDGISHDQ